MPGGLSHLPLQFPLSSGCFSPYGCGTMRMMFAAPVLALFLAAGNLHAAIGETQSQIVKRYGGTDGGTKYPPMAITNKDLTVYFDYKDYVVGVTFLEGIVARETYTRKDKKALTDVEIQDLLASNASGGKWVQVEDNKNAKIWILDSKQGMAGYYKSDPYLSVQTPQMLAFDEAIKQIQVKQAPPQAAPPANNAPKP